MRIKEGDEWKAAFTIHVGSFEPVVMFFGMTNSPATFQAMMNEILRNMINEGKVAAFVDDVLVGTVMETLDSTELFMEDQTWLDYLWDFETREINLDLPSDTD